MSIQNTIARIGIALILMILIAIIVSTFSGCSPRGYKGVYNEKHRSPYPVVTKMDSTELSHWYHLSDTIYFDSSNVAHIQSFEFEHIPGYGVQQEISVTHTNMKVQTLPIMRYLHTMHPKAKIEINYDKPFTPAILKD